MCDDEEVTSKHKLKILYKMQPFNEGHLLKDKKIDDFV